MDERLKVLCRAEEDLVNTYWVYEEVCIHKGELFEAMFRRGDFYVFVEGHGFKDDCEYIGLGECEILEEIKGE